MNFAREELYCVSRILDVVMRFLNDKNIEFQACSSRDTVSRELKDLQSKIQKEKELYKSQEKDYVERMEKQKQHIEKLMAELSNCKEELDRANKRISELQREFTDKQREFTEKLDKYLQGWYCGILVYYVIDKYSIIISG